jgi:hypothetical protein
MKKILFYLGLFVNVVAYNYKILPITSEVKARMQYSWNDNNPVSLGELCYITLDYWGFDDKAHTGELITHKDLALEVAEIFQELFEVKYPIEKMKLVDEYLANDEVSCADNNSSAFCSRPITGTTNRWSMHSYGLAIDINPKQNPYCKGKVVVPQNGQLYLNRNLDVQGMIKEGDACYNAFISRGWEWGGHWAKYKGYLDYQHFAKEINSSDDI